MANVRLLAIYDKFAAEEMLDTGEERLYSFSMNPWLSYYENNHFQYEMGLLSSEHWLSSRNAMRSLAGNPLFQERWTNARSSWREWFAQEVDKLIAEENAERRAGN